MAITDQEYQKIKSTIKDFIKEEKVSEEKFDVLDQNALSGASLGQVHLALKNGQQVIV